MKPVLINAKELKQEKIKQLKTVVESMVNKPQLVIISASNDKASENYVRNKIRTGEEVGVDVKVNKFDENSTTGDILEVINNLNNNPSVDGIILQLPTYKHLDSEKLIQAISSKKDADCFSSTLLGDLLQNRGNVKPCTPNGVINLLEYHNIEIEGKDVLILGRSTHVGLSLSVMLTQMGATVSCAHSKTKDLDSKVKQSDIVISCVGKHGLIKPEWTKKDSILIGVGITVDDNFKQQTDYNIDSMLESGNCKFVGDRVNTTGTCTVLSLIENLIILSKNKGE